MPVYRSHLLTYHDLKLGQRLREERQRKDLTLTEMAARTNISIGRLSQIENDLHIPDVRQALTIAHALEISLESLFPSQITTPYQITREVELRQRAPQQAPLLEARTGQRVFQHHRYWPLAEAFVGRHIEPLFEEIAPVADDEMRYSYGYEHEFLFVLRGAAEFSIQTPAGTLRESLGQGDCVYFRSDLPHAVRAAGAEPAEALHILSAGTVPMQTGWDWLSPSAAGYVTDQETSVAHKIGREISALREAHGWTVKAVAAQVGLSERRLEQIEAGARSVPLDVMIKLARAFGKPLRQFVRDTADPRPYYFVQRSTNIASVPPRTRRLATDSPTPNIYRPLSGEFPTHYMFPNLVTVRDGGVGVPDFHEHHGQEFTYVLSGELEITTYVESQQVTETLRAGDTCYFESSVPHAMRGRSRNPYSQVSAEILHVFWCPLGSRYLFKD